MLLLNGLISAGLNHAMHYVYNTVQRTITIKQMLIDAGYKVRGIPTFTVKYIKDMIHKIPLLQEWYELGGEPDIVWVESKKYAGLILNGKIFLSKVNIKTNYSLLVTSFHEIYHACQDISGLTAIITRLYGPVDHKFGVPSISAAILEVGAYSFEISLGNNNSSAASQLLRHQQIVSKYFSR